MENKLKKDASKISSDMTEENKEKIQEVGGCEVLYKTHMVDVNYAKEKEEGMQKEVTMRVRYLEYLEKGRRRMWDLMGGEGSPSGKGGAAGGDYR